MTTCNTSWHSLVVVYSVASFGEARSSPNDNSLFDYYVTEEGLHHTLHPPPPICAAQGPRGLPKIQNDNMYGVHRHLYQALQWMHSTFKYWTWIDPLWTAC